MRSGCWWRWLASSRSPARHRPTDISGAGATFPYPIYSKWADAYKQKTGVGLNYQSIGSGGGIKQIKAKTVTFGASDMPLEARGAEGSRPGAVPDDHRRRGAGGERQGRAGRSSWCSTAPTVASIYLGEITKWNDARIKKLNPKLTLPDATIAPIYRSDGSGTNFLFSDYLSKSSPKFKETVGANTSVQWPVGIGAKGNEGVANMTTQTDGAIGYVEYAYAKQNSDGLRGPRQQGRQAGRARARMRSRPRPPMPTGRMHRATT